MFSYVQVSKISCSKRLGGETKLRRTTGRVTEDDELRLDKDIAEKTEWETGVGLHATKAVGAADRSVVHIATRLFGDESVYQDAILCN